MESSTDSEDEVLQRFQQSSSYYSGLRKVGGSEDQNGGNTECLFIDWSEFFYF